MIRAAAVFSCVVASGALTVEPKHGAVASVHETKHEPEVKHTETKTAAVAQAPKKVINAKKAAVPPHHADSKQSVVKAQIEKKQTPVKAKTEKKHSTPVALSRKTVAIKPLDPKLTPESDEKFMKGDYPYDKRPEVTQKFEGVYPKMQSTKKYNSDYVKDENGDGGHWAAQMKYDELKNKLAVQRKKTKEALAKEQEERKEHEEASEEHKEHEQKAVEAEKDAIKAEKEADEAEKDLEKAEEADKKDKDKEPQNLAAAEEKVKAAQVNLQGCEQKLEDARKELEQAKKKEGSSSGEKVVATEQTAEQKAAAKERAEADKAVAAAEAEREKTNEEEAEHEKAKKEYNAEKKEEEKTESDLDKADAELRKLRGEEPKKNTVAKEEKSAATSFSPMLAVAGALCLVALK